jgi:tetratricopeptide (TPR) repeat protein
MTLTALERDEAAPSASDAGATRSAGSQRAILVDRAYSEYCRLYFAGDTPDASEFCARYPAIQHSLARMLSVHRMVHGDEQLLGVPKEKPEAPWPQPDTRFLGFQLERELGRGAFSRVYLARETALGDRTVVVKISRWGMSEARTLGRLGHPNIVPVYSVTRDEQSDRSAVCMPYLGEGTLCDVLDRVLAGGAPPRHAIVILDAARKGPCLTLVGGADHMPLAATNLQYASYVDGVRCLAEQLLDALAFIHTEGVLHRDLKPSNVLLTRNGTPMLLDFNLSGDNRRCEVGFGGTPGYMSPEQLRLMARTAVDASALDGRADLFSLGVILYQLLTGEHPFTPPPAGTELDRTIPFLLERYAAGAPSVRKLNPAVDRRLAALIDGCMAYAPADRPASAHAARALLNCSPGSLTRLVRALARRPYVSLAALAGAALIAVGGAFTPGLARPSELARGEEAYRQGEFTLAVEHFGRHLNRAPDDAHAWFLCGVAHLRQQQYVLAAETLSRAEELQSDGLTCACLGYAHQMSKDVKAAPVYYEKALATGYESAALRNNLGYFHLKLGPAEKALESLDRAVALEATLQAAYHNRGCVYLLLETMRRATPGKRGLPPATTATRDKLLNAALDDLTRAIDIGPPSAELYKDAAQACAELGLAHPELRARAVEYLARALDHGIDRNILNQRPFTTKYLGTESAYPRLPQRHRVGDGLTVANRVVAILPD